MNELKYVRKNMMINVILYDRILGDPDFVNLGIQVFFINEIILQMFISLFNLNNLLAKPLY